MSDLTHIEQQFRLANPVPDPADPPVGAPTAAMALLDIETRSIDMQTQQQQVEEQPFPESPRNRTRLIGALVAAAVVILVIVVSVALFGGDDEAGVDVVDQPEISETEPEAAATPEPEPAAPTDEAEPEEAASPAVEELEFCEIEIAISEAHDLAGFDGPSGMVDLGISGEVKALYADLVAAAPAEIEAEVESTSERFVALIVLWEEANGDSSQLDRDAHDLAMERFFSSVNETEGEVVDVWLEANC